MPNGTQEVEATLADLGIGIVSEKLPTLINSYLGFELIQANDERTRAAGLLGFKVGSELLYIPVLFLNGKVKGTEVLYLAGSDVFTSGSKQWVEYLTSRNPGIVGRGEQTPRGLTTPSPAQLQIFRNLPQGKYGAFRSDKFVKSEFMEGAADEFIQKIASDHSVVDLPGRAEFNFPNVLRSMGKRAYLNFMEQLVDTPELFAKVAEFYDIKDLEIGFGADYPAWALDFDPAAVESDPSLSDTQKKAVLDSWKEHEPHVRAFIEDLPKRGALGAMPDIGGPSDYASAVAQQQPPTSGAIQPDIDPINAAKASPVHAPNLATQLSAGKIPAAQVPSANMALSSAGHAPAPAGGAGGIGDWIQNNPGTALLGGAAAIGIPWMAYQMSKKQKEEEALRRGKVAIYASADILSDHIKAAALSIEEKEHAMTHGFVVLDKRAEDEKALTTKDDYLTRFDQPRDSGFYEIVNRFGQLQKAFVATQPFVLENPSIAFPKPIIVDPESGVFVLPGANDEILVRHQLLVEEGRWKDTLGGMSSITSVTPGKTYMMVSPDLKVSAPFTVKNKIKGETVSFVAESPWDVRYRALNSGSDDCCSGPPSLSGMDGCTVKIVDRADVSKVVQIGGVTFVPSSWKVMELTPDEDYKYDVHRAGSLNKSVPPPGAQAKRDAYAKITPGGPTTLTNAILNKGLFELELNKSGSFVVIRYQNETQQPMNKIAAIRYLVGELGMDAGAALEAYGEAMDSNLKVSRWVKAANPAELSAAPAVHRFGGALGRVLNGVGSAPTPPPTSASGTMKGGSTFSPAGMGAIAGATGGLAASGEDDSKLRNAAIGAGAGALGGLAMQGYNATGSLDGAAGNIAKGLTQGGDALQQFAMKVRNFAKVHMPKSAFLGLKREKGTVNANGDSEFNDDLFAKIEAIRRRGGGKMTDAEWEASGKPGKKHAINREEIYSSQPFPEDNSDMGYNELGFREQQSQSQRQEIEMQNLSDPSHDWRNLDEANWDRIQKKDVDFLMRAANSGSQPVFDSAMIGVLLRTNRASSQVSEWLPDLVNALDTKCRLLLLFYWHNQDFSEDYGEDEMAEFEDVLLNSIKVDGQLVLFLKQRAGESSSTKIDALSAD